MNKNAKGEGKANPAIDTRDIDSNNMSLYLALLTANISITVKCVKKCLILRLSGDYYA